MAPLQASTGAVRTERTIRVSWHQGLGDCACKPPLPPGQPSPAFSIGSRKHSRRGACSPFNWLYPTSRVRRLAVDSQSAGRDLGQGR